MGSKEEVNRFIVILKIDGCTIARETIISENEYYKSAIFDLEGNRIELIAQEKII